MSHRLSCGDSLRHSTGPILVESPRANVTNVGKYAMSPTCV